MNELLVDTGNDLYKLEELNIDVEKLDEDAEALKVIPPLVRPPYANAAFKLIRWRIATISTNIEQVSRYTAAFCAEILNELRKQCMQELEENPNARELEIQDEKPKRSESWMRNYH